MQENMNRVWVETIKKNLVLKISIRSYVVDMQKLLKYEYNISNIVPVSEPKTLNLPRSENGERIAERLHDRCAEQRNT